MITAISAIIVIGVLVLVHEFGHYIVARYLNVKVLKFSIGFGPKIYGIQKGETEYLVSAVPLGGYVKLYGEDDEDIAEDKDRAFNQQTPIKRIMIVFAGPLLNFIFAFMVFFMINTIGFKTISAKVGDVKESYPAHKAGIKKGDIITKIAGKNVKAWEDVSKAIKGNSGNQIEITYTRGSDTFMAGVLPKKEKAKNMFGEEAETMVIGVVSSDELVTISYPIHQALYRGYLQVYELTKLTILTIQKLIQRTIPMSSLGGPILITKLAGETAKSGPINFIVFMALLSVNLGVLNLLPIPILDGGHILLFSYEAVSGKKVSARFKEVFVYIGIVIIGLLTAIVFYNDIVRVFLKN
jgi:regulator of sigma E protease